MSESRFVGTVLRRYTWIVPSGEALSEGAAREAFIEDVLRGKKGDIAMPAWEGDPAVTASIRDLYTYLRARAEGRLGRHLRPAPGREELGGLRGPGPGGRPAVRAAVGPGRPPR